LAALCGGAPAGKTKVLPPLLAYSNIFWGYNVLTLFIYTLRVLLPVVPRAPLIGWL
jgi:hypothetical protein